MPTIRIPTPLRPFTGGNPAVVVAGATVGAALQDLAVRYPDLHRHLYAESGELRPFVNVFLSEDNVRELQGVGTPVKDSDILRIVPAMAGGQQLERRTTHEYRS